VPHEIRIAFTRFSAFCSPPIATIAGGFLKDPRHAEITRPAWEATVDIFLHPGLITRRHRYEDVIARPL
jgi:hypothetical protein